MAWDLIVWECIKLTAQGGAAFLVARFAVRWALDRFKQEKVWERRLSAQADIIVALAEMRRLYGRWIDEIEEHRSTNEDADREHTDRFRQAARRLEEAMPLAQLLLSSDTSKLLAKLENDRDGVRSHDMYEDYCKQYSLLDDAIGQLVQDGRSLLP